MKYVFKSLTSFILMTIFSLVTFGNNAHAKPSCGFDYARCAEYLDNGAIGGIIAAFCVVYETIAGVICWIIDML